ncbi:competence type IV pilus assembly protein ComGB [Solibacillus sp. FSL K6-1523]|uniref:competence type IV pilus assembly protein ComGB n=1 Tax=Solibacillus sp. FSL K6-1523 TaxID=2921471 RepID=UPI0030F6ACA1
MNLPLLRGRVANFSVISFRKAKVSDFPTFLERIGDLLKEGYTFAHCIQMLLPFHMKQYEEMQESVKEVLHDGGGATQVLKLLGLEKQYLVSIELAELTGQLAETVQIVSQQLTFQQEMKSKLVKVLSYPVLLFVFLMGLFLAFRTFFLPNISTMVTSRAQNDTSTSVQWSKFFLHMPDYIIVLVAILLSVVAAFIFYIKRKRVDLQLSLLFKIPLLGHFWKLLLTRHFSRVLGNLLLAGFSLQHALGHLKKQEHQIQIAYVAQVLQEKVVLGDTLAEAVQIDGYFYPKFEHFIAHGESSGMLGRELILYCELLDTRLQVTIRFLMTMIQPLLFMIIAACVIAAYLSILLPMYDVLDFI